MLAVALGKDDVKGEQRRRAQDRDKALAGKSTLNRLELTAPDYDGSPRQEGSHKPETKKIVWTRRASMPLLVDLFLEAHEQVPDRIVLNLDATEDTLYGHPEGRFYHGYYRITAICRCMYFAENICYVSACGCPISMPLPIRWRNWSRWWRTFASAGRW
jgi:hypothetical protein